MLESIKRLLGDIAAGARAAGLVTLVASALVVGDIVLVTCYEELSDSIMVATNGFVEERGIIKLFHHHAGPCEQPPRPTSAKSDRAM